MKQKRILGKNILLILTAVLIVFLLFPLCKNLKFGLDLQGGFEVLYQVEGVNGEDVTSDMVTSTYKTMLKRIDGLGVSEPSIIIEGQDKIRVQLAGVNDSEAARNILGKTASLTFRDTNAIKRSFCSLLKPLYSDCHF